MSGRIPMSSKGLDLTSYKHCSPHGLVDTRGRRSPDQEKRG